MTWNTTSCGYGGQCPFRMMFGTMAYFLAKSRVMFVVERHPKSGSVAPVRPKLN